MPSALASWRRSSRIAAPTPAAAAIAPNTAVGWKPALCTALGATKLSRQIVSTPTAIPLSAIPPVEAFLLRRGQHRWDDHRARVHRTAFKGVVEILAMRRRAVDESRARRAQGVGVADDRGSTVLGPGRPRRDNIVGLASNDAQADDIDEQSLTDRAHCRCQPVAVDGGDASRPGIAIPMAVGCSRGAVAVA